MRRGRSPAIAALLPATRGFTSTRLQTTGRWDGSLVVIMLHFLVAPRVGDHAVEFGRSGTHDGLIVASSLDLVRQVGAVVVKCR